MMKKGTMRYVKKGIGVVLGISVINYFYPIIPINVYLNLVAMSLASYFLIISGRQL